MHLQIQGLGRLSDKSLPGHNVDFLEPLWIGVCVCVCLVLYLHHGLRNEASFLFQEFWEDNKDLCASEIAYCIIKMKTNLEN